MHDPADPDADTRDADDPDADTRDADDPDADTRDADNPDADTRDAFDTRAVHAGAEPDELTGAVSPPIYQTSTYAQDGVGRPRDGYEYGRTQNPTRARLERAVADLEGGRHGIAFASGSATTSAIAQLAARGEEILVGDDVYGGTYRYFEHVHRPSGAAEARYVDLASGPDALWERLTGSTRLVWFETPSNPLLKVTDIAAAATVLHDRSVQDGATRPLMVVDNTFASPALQRPLELGADIVFHSATKYLGGHSDAILGVAVTSDDSIADRLRFLQNAMGAVPGPFDCFLVLRGLRTLALRMERHCANAMAVATYLASRPDVASVRYPGLSKGQHAHPSAAIASRQMRLGDSPAYGGMVSFTPAPGGRHAWSAVERAAAVAETTRLFALAESLGGVESLIEIPAAMTHMSVASSDLAVDPALIRLSVGIEAAGDLIADLAQALDRA
jgi:cystathionine gamma-synthase